jgi:hypothetical protein
VNGVTMRFFFGNRLSRVKDPMAVRSKTRHEDSVVLSLDAMMERQKRAQYPELLSVASPQEAGPLYDRRRSGSGLIAVARRHSGLTDAQKSALSEFRLDQYTLCGFYDQEYLRDHQITHDPDLDELPPDTIHIVIGSSDGRVLAYSYIQPPNGALSGVASTVGGSTMGDTDRPWFPCEVESFGPTIFSSLPALRPIPVAQVAEVSILLRNQLEHGVSSVYAVVESILAMAFILTMESTNLRATVAYGGHEARQIIYDMGMPGLYAPRAPVVYNALPPHWSASANIPGRFWPCVFSTDDFLEGIEHLRALDSILDLPANELRRDLVKFRRSGRRIAIRALVPEPGASNVLWITTPDLPEEEAEAAV